MTPSWHTEVPGFRWLKRGQTLLEHEWMHWNHPNSVYSWYLSAVATLRSLLAALSRHPAWEDYKLSSLFMGKQAPVSYFGTTRNPAWLEDNHTKGTCFLPFSILFLSPLAPWKQQRVSPSVTTCHPSQAEVACTNTIEEKYWVIPRAWMLQSGK